MDRTLGGTLLGRFGILVNQFGPISIIWDSKQIPDDLGLWQQDVYLRGGVANARMLLNEHAATYQGLGMQALEWTLTHEFAHAIDEGDSDRMRLQIDTIAYGCPDTRDGPTWYRESKPKNIYFAGPSEDWADSVALFVLGEQHPFFKHRQARGKSSVPTFDRRINVGDGRPGISIRMNLIRSAFGL
jgi:hypothetical protein